MLSYISRRRKLLPSLDIIIELCGPMRVELHFELSELSRKPGHQGVHGWQPQFRVRVCCPCGAVTLGFRVRV